MSIIYTKSLVGITADMLDGGFFVGWPNPPSPATHLRILQNAYCAYMAIDEDVNKVIGFINAVSDGVLSAYIPLLEVIPGYQGRGVGGELVKLMLAELKDLYMVDICHDDDKSGFYAKFDPYQGGRASCFRNYCAQAGKIEKSLP